MLAVKQQRQQPAPLRLDQLHHLGVVLVRHARHVDPLLLVLSKHRLEDGLVEHALELLVGEVDAQLLERVRVKDLEPEDVQDADEEARARQAVILREEGRRRRRGGRRWRRGGRRRGRRRRERG